MVRTKLWITDSVCGVYLLIDINIIKYHYMLLKYLTYTLQINGFVNSSNLFGYEDIRPDMQFIFVGGLHGKESLHFFWYWGSHGICHTRSSLAIRHTRCTFTYYKYLNVNTYNKCFIIKHAHI